MSIRTLAVIASLALLFALAGCSGGSPVANDFDSKVASTEGTFGDGVFMRAKLHIDLDTMTAEITPYRNTSAVGDLFADLEITSFLIYPFCSDATCLYVKGLGIIAGTPPDISVTVGVRHPFAQYTGDPPTGNNRADLDLFDMRAYLINDGGASPNPEKVTVAGLAPSGNIIFTPGFVIGADGYDDGADALPVDAADALSADELIEVTSYNFGGTTTMQPYMRVFEGAGDPFVFEPGDAPIAEDNRMSHGEGDEATFVISLEPGAGAVDFDLAICGSFGASAQGRANRTPSNVKYFQSFRATRPFIGMQDPATTAGDTVGGTNPKLNFWIRHPWAGLTAAASLDEYKLQMNGGALLPPDAKGPGEADLTFACRLVDSSSLIEYNYAVLPTATEGDGKDATAWKFSLDLEDPTNPGNPLPDGTYNVYIYVEADCGDLSAYPFAPGDDYTLYYISDIMIETI
jgi:hypothetical protein